MLSQLEHPNIIRSCGCWTEPDLQSLNGLDEESTESQPNSLSTEVNWTSCSPSFGDKPMEKPTKYLFLQMDLCDCTLTEWIQATASGMRMLGATTCRADRYLTLFHQLCKGLQYLHDLQYIHNDLKPANVCLLKGVVKLMDFGLSSSPFAAAGVGTPLYAAPEAIRSMASDVFSLGLIFYKMSLCGTPMPMAERHRLVAAMREAGVAPTDVPHAGVMQRMVARHPDCRPVIAAVIEEVFQDPKAPASPLEVADPPVCAPSDELASFADLLVDAAVIANSKGIVVAINHTASEMFGYAPSELLGHSINQLMPKHYARAHDGYMRRYLQGLSTKNLIGVPTPLPVCCKDGRTIRAEICLGEMVRDGEHHFLACFRPLGGFGTAAAEKGGCPFACSRST